MFRNTLCPGLLSARTGQGRKWLCFVSLILGSLVPWHARAATLSAIPAEDTFISEGSPPSNGTELIIGTQGTTSGSAKNRGLMRFDLAGIPSGATINSVSLQMTVLRAPNSLSINFNLHRLLRAWSEAGSTWELRVPPDQTWAAPGGAEGTDYAAAVSGSAAIAGPAAYTFVSTPAMVSDVTAWVADPSANHGWLMKQTDESVAFGARRFAASEALSGAPQLTVDYTAAPPLRIESANISDGQFCLGFTARAGKSYRVERRSDLVSGMWSTVTTLPPAGTDRQETVCDPLGAGAGFYRVVEF
ncbi:MAG: DNRLRE domain-containing protein [Verrucomicrobia subdivision 3 bacterium]|nr:DNRLRE domain-containing protein [Limisphaerales bacterium]